MIVELTPKQLDQCKQLQAQCRTNGNHTAGGNYTGLEDGEAYYKGYMGELAAVAALTELGVSHRHEINTNGRSQASEIVLEHCGDRRIEVKTAGELYHAYTAWPQAQPRDWDILIGCAIVGDNLVDVRGWIGSKDADRIEVRKLKIDTCTVPWARLRPLRHLPRAYLAAQTTNEWIAAYEAA